MFAANRNLTDGRKRLGAARATGAECRIKTPCDFISVFLLSVVLSVVFTAVGGCKPRNAPEATPQMDVDRRFWVRVLLLNNVSKCRVNIDSAFSIAGSGTETPPSRFERDQANLVISRNQDQVQVGDLYTFYDEAEILPDPPHIIHIDGEPHRGVLRIIANSESETFDVVNLVPLEPYLAGVVGAEMPPYWEPAALQAQAVAARTYCLYTKKRFGKNRHWDVSRTQATQVYKGVQGESERIWDAVNRTRGMVLMCRGDGIDLGLFPTYYSSNCGGHTENAESVFGEHFEALQGVPCPYCRKVAKPDSFFWPVVQLDKSEIQEQLFSRYPNLRRLGRIEQVLPLRTSDYGKFARLTMVKLIGSTGRTDSLRGEDFRLSLDPTGRKLRSAAFKMVDRDEMLEFASGRGWGHAVGMCQCGAQAMARNGASFHAILRQYYPAAELMKVY